MIQRRVGARSRVAGHLESQVAPGRISRLLASITGSFGARHLARPLELPRGTYVIGVGGATLGGSSKTPFAIALARELAAVGPVAFVGHAYGAHPGRARLVSVNDDVREVGDDALVAAWSLGRADVRADVGDKIERTDVGVVVAPSRQEALDFAAKLAPCVVVDGLLQTRPHRLGRSLLLLGPGDARRFCPPAGDLRAPPTALFAAADARVIVRDELDPPWQSAVEMGYESERSALEMRPEHRTPGFDVISRLRDVRFEEGGRRIRLAELVAQGTRFGLVLAVARPDRIVHALTRRQFYPEVVLLFGDHESPGLAELEAATTTHRIDLWLTTPKCAMKLKLHDRGLSIALLQRDLALPPGLTRWVVGEAHEGPSLPSSPARRA